MGKTWIPYVGLRGRNCKKPCPSIWDPEYRWRVIGSPLAWNQWRNAFDINCRNLASVPPIIEITRTEYELDANNGRFVEGSLEATTGLTPNLRAGFWFTGSWYEIEGNGQVNALVQQSDDFLGQAGTNSVADSSYSKSFIALGLQLEMGF
jgi:hypothetical protein